MSQQPTKLWELTDTELLRFFYNLPEDEQQKALDVLNNSMAQNLDHARHVENERMSMTVGITALVAAVMAFCTSLTSFVPQILVYVSTLLLLWISLRLTMRWNTAFKDHMDHAKGCEHCLHTIAFSNPADIESARIAGQLSTFPDIASTYCFSVRPGNYLAQYDPRRTHGKFTWLCALLMIVVLCALVVCILEQCGVISALVM